MDMINTSKAKKLKEKFFRFYTLLFITFIIIFTSLYLLVFFLSKLKV